MNKRTCAIIWILRVLFIQTILYLTPALLFFFMGKTFAVVTVIDPFFVHHVLKHIAYFMGALKTV